MNVVIRDMGRTHRKQMIRMEWPEGWSLPTTGDQVELNDNEKTIIIHDVVWYPNGDEGLALACMGDPDFYFGG